MSNEVFEIKYLDEPAWEVIGGGLSDFNTRQAGDDEGKNLCFVLQTPEGEIVGGVIGATYWDWLYVNLMWVREDLRGRVSAISSLRKRKPRPNNAALNVLTWTHSASRRLSSIRNLAMRNLAGWKISPPVIPAISWSKRFKVSLGQIYPAVNSRIQLTAQKIASAARATQIRIMIAPTTQFFGFPSGKASCA